MICAEDEQGRMPVEEVGMVVRSCYGYQQRHSFPPMF